MQLTNRIIRLIILTLIFSPFSLIADQVSMDVHRIKLYFVYPLSSLDGIYGSWLEVLMCDESGRKCTDLIDRIRLSDLKVKSLLSLRFDKIGSLSLLINEGKHNELELTRVIPKSGWYPRQELCSDSAGSSACIYELLRDEDHRTLTIKIQAKN